MKHINNYNKFLLNEDKKEEDSLDKFRVTDLKSAKIFLEECVKIVGTGFHPDTQFSDYIDVVSGLDTFAENPGYLDDKIDKCFDYFEISNEDLYQYVFSLIKKI